MANIECVIYGNKICDNCGECDLCDITPGKICDNCGRCMEEGDYRSIQIDELIVDPEEIGNYDPMHESIEDLLGQEHVNNGDCCSHIHDHNK
jgi:hypothetical protein